MALFGRKHEDRLDTPQGAAVDPLAGTAIHVIPEQFYGAAVRGDARVHAPTADMPIAPAAPAPMPAMPAPALPAVPPELPPDEHAIAPPPRRRRGWLVVLLLLLVLLGGGGAGAWWYFFGRSSGAAPQAPVCGNLQCETGESTSSCASDCRPAAACGDARCDAGETAASCAVDCAPTPVAPVCGNAQCEIGETTLSCLTDCPPPEPQPGADADNDGLTDVEERTVFGTDPGNANTDRDSFVDLNEVLNLFDPAIPAPAGLDKNPGITAFARAGFTALAPASWQVQVVQPAQPAPTPAPEAATPPAAAETTPAAPETPASPVVPTEWTLTAGSGETFVVRVLEKPATESLRDWYLRTYSGEAPATVELLTNRRGLPYIMAPDRLRAWVDLGTTIVAVRYDLAGARTIEYKNLFAMVVASVAKR